MPPSFSFIPTITPSFTPRYMPKSVHISLFSGPGRRETLMHTILLQPRIYCIPKVACNQRSVTTVISSCLIYLDVFPVPLLQSSLTVISHISSTYRLPISRENHPAVIIELKAPSIALTGGNNITRSSTGCVKLRHPYSRLPWLFSVPTVASLLPERNTWRGTFPAVSGLFIILAPNDYTLSF